MEEEPPNFGAELKDAFKPVNAWVKGGISWMTDVEEFFRERSLIEREYAGKLNQLAKKYFEKKAKKASSLSVGDTPTLTPGSLESASMTTWTTLLTSTELVAQEHDRLGMDINIRVAEATKVLGIRLDDVRKRHEALESKLTKERDSQYSDLKKAKASYDSTCKDLEEKRVKVEKSFDSSRAKAERGYQAQMGEMHNIKNTYIIAINVTNAQKEKYYHSDIPDVLSSLQDLNEMRVEYMNALWTLSCSLSSATHSKCIEHYNTLSSEVSRNSPQLDSLMFIRHNAPANGEWLEPQDFLFEASPIWHDTGEVIVDENAKVWLQNKISKSKGGLEGFRRDVEKRRKDVELLKNKREGIRKSGEPMAGKRSVDEMDILKTLLSTQEELMAVDGKRVTLEVEVETVRHACGDIDQGAQSHKFKSTSFKIPTICDVCHDKIWGLSAKGMSCKDCGFNCHSKCEMKVPANCPGPLDKAGKKAIKEARHVKHDSNTGNGGVDRLAELPASNGSSTTLGRSNTSASTASTDPQMGRSNSLFSKTSISSKPAARRVLAPPPQKYVTELPTEVDHSSEPRGKMLYTFTGQTDGELSVSEGKEIVIVDEDDGSGWLKVRNGMQEGLVPTAYVEIFPHSKSAPAPRSPTTPTPTTPFSDRPPSSYSSSSASLAASLTGTSTKKKGPAVAPRRGAKKVNYAEALYDYQARTEDEFDMTVGDRFVLVNPNTGDGWAEVEKNGVTKSVPSNYITSV